MKIETGKKVAPLRAVIYGPEGIGKTTLAARFPRPLFVDIEQGTNEIEVARTPVPQSWAALLAIMAEAQGVADYDTVVIDTADWAERLASRTICEAAHVQSLGDVDYGALYRKVLVAWGQFLDLASKVAESKHVVMLAHSQIVHCQIPEEIGTFDRYELKLLNSFKVNLAALTKEWASLVLFCSYETEVVKVEKTETKAQGGGRRVLYSTHHACWDAKQRTGFDLPEKMLFERDSMPPALAALIARTTPQRASEPPLGYAQMVGRATLGTEDSRAPMASFEAGKPLPFGLDEKAAETTPAATQPPPQVERIDQLLHLAGMKRVHLMTELARAGVVPANMPLEDCNTQTLDRVVAGWEKVKACIAKYQKDNIPF